MLYGFSWKQRLAVFLNSSLTVWLRKSSTFRNLWKSLSSIRRLHRGQKMVIRMLKQWQVQKRCRRGNLHLKLLLKTQSRFGRDQRQEVIYYFWIIFQILKKQLNYREKTEEEQEEESSCAGKWADRYRYWGFRFHCWHVVVVCRLFFELKVPGCELVDGVLPRYSRCIHDRRVRQSDRNKEVWVSYSK